MLLEAMGLDGFLGAAADFFVGDFCAVCPVRDPAGIESFLPGWMTLSSVRLFAVARLSTLIP